MIDKVSVKKIIGENIQKDRKIAELERELMYYKKSYNTISNSKIWRITGPIRKTLDIIKGEPNSLHNHIMTKANLQKVIASLRTIGVKATAQRVMMKLRGSKQYEIWYERNCATEEKLREQKATKFVYEPLISVITPTFNTPEKFLRAMIESVLAQSYDKWELCIADGSTDKGNTYKIIEEYGTKDKRIKIKQIGENKGISGNSNEALTMAKGDYIALLDHDDLLTPDALYEMVKTINETSADFIYSDEDKTDEQGKKSFDPTFKPDFAPDYFLTNNYLCHFSVIKKDLLDKAGKYFASSYDGAQDFDLFLRCSEHTKQIVHLPKILYHWRIHKGSAASGLAAKPYTHEAGIKVLQAHFARCKIKATAMDGPYDLPNVYKVEYEIIDNPLVSIIIPNCNHREDLQKCLQSIINKSTYNNYEILVVENNSNEQDVFAYYKKIEGHNNIRVLYYPEEFNYSRINNWAVKQVKGKYVVLMNNDVTIISPDWLEEMLMYAQRGDVGAVGAKLLYPDDTVQHGGVIVGAGLVAHHPFLGIAANNPGYAGRAVLVQNWSAVTAALMMLPKKAFEQIKGFDENIAVAYNDVDLCLRLRQAGYLIVCNPDVLGYHYESKSRGYDNTVMKRKRADEEIEYFHKKWGKDLHDPYYNVNLEELCSMPFRM